MRSFRVLISCLGLGLALAAAPAAAQEMYPGQSVLVNPGAAGTRVLLYPGNQYVRMLPPLREPGGTLEPIHLHMPVHHRIARIHRAPKVAAADTTDTASVTPDVTPAPVEAPPPPAPRHTRHSKTQVADTTPAPDTSAPASDSDPAAIPFSFSGNAPMSPSRHTAKPAKVASAEPPPTQTPAPAATPAKSAAEPGLAKRGEIVFNHDATDPAPAQYDGLKLLAGDLNSALQSGATRIQLEAYGGAPGDKSSDARRLSLKRALAIRQVLIDNGVPSGKIDVRAMGGIDDHGNADRVDVLLRG
jgi:outer membrane protein OmpA-like peptidoglycan-associated protein